MAPDVGHWTLTTHREKLIKTGATVVRHSKYVIFQLGEVAVSRELFAPILERIKRFAMPPPSVGRAYAWHGSSGIGRKIAEKPRTSIAKTCARPPDRGVASG